jgi:hypothetical protein
MHRYVLRRMSSRSMHVLCESARFICVLMFVERFSFPSRRVWFEKAPCVGGSTRSWWPILSASRGKSTGLSVSRIAVIFGTHNWESCDVVMEELVKANLARKEEIQGDGQTVVSVRDEVVQRVAIAQLYGMCGGLTDSLVDRTASNAPLVMK